MPTRRLIVETAEGSRELLFVGRLTVGRAAECDISLNDGKVSRRHAELDATGPDPRVTDLGSRNGMLVNNRKVTSADLRDGDVIVVGDARIRVEIHADSTVTALDATASHDHADERTSAGETVPPAIERQAAAPLPVPPARETPVSDDRTAVVAPPRSAASSQPPVAAAVPEDDRTAVIPRPSSVQRQDPPPAAASAAHVAGGMADVSPVPPSVIDASAPAAPRPAASGAPVPAAGVQAPPPAVPAAPPTGLAATPSSLPSPRFTWGGLTMLLCVGLAALVTLMTAVPLLSSGGQSIDLLARRQARTLATWLASGIAQDSSGLAADALLQSVRAQDGVSDALVLNATTRRIVAPGRLANSTLDSLPGPGDDWPSLTEARVWVTGTVADAAVPVSREGTRFVAWVRYDVPSSSDRTIALIVAIVGGMVLAVVASVLLRRHTAAMLGVFTRQVELAVSGSDVRVMQGTLVPGLDRLPGIVAYLLEQRRAGAGATRATLGAAHAGVDAAVVEAPEVLEPAWLVVTPSLSVTLTSPHAPPDGIRNWGGGTKGRHLLDVLEPGPLCNAVVQGLGALSNAPGAAMTVPAEGRAPVTLRREAEGHVRIELPMR